MVYGLMLSLLFTLAVSKGEVNKQGKKAQMEKYENLPPNTTMNDDGSLSCIDGYFGDEKIDDLGCFKCEECSKNELCSRKGCYVPKPELLAVGVKGHIIVNYTVSDAGFTPLTAECSVDKMESKAISVSPNHVVCILPSGKKEFDISLSFGSKVWSDPLHYVPKSSVGLVIAIVMAVVVVIVLGLSAFFMYWNKGKGSKHNKMNVQHGPLAYFPSVNE